MSYSAFRWQTAERLPYTDTAAPSAVIGVADPQRRDNADILVRIVASTDCFIAVGANPEATTNSSFLPALVVETLAVRPGDRLSVVRRTADGFLSITPLGLRQG